jgi:hypothetical protein
MRRHLVLAAAALLATAAALAANRQGDALPTGGSRRRSMA